MSRPDEQVPEAGEVLAGAVPLAEVRRGSLPEVLHAGVLSIVEPSGEVFLSAGEDDLPFVLRSSAKPIQALVSVLEGTVDAFGLTQEELAVACASHAGEPRHVRRVLSILEKAGLAEDDLLCGVHPPFPRTEVSADPPPDWGVLNNNCSGKHALFLATCVHRGWTPDSYRSPEHPLQLEVRRLLAFLGGMEEDDARWAVDGCGVPAWGIPLRAAATAFARLTDPSSLDADLAAACRRVVGAMTAHPGLVAGRERFCTDLMEAAAGRIWAKIGAEGYYALGMFGGEERPPLGMALKILDGDPHLRARATVTLEIAERFGLLDPPAASALRDKHAPPVLRNHKGIEVGRLSCLL